jgi:hypothetical protein
MADTRLCTNCGVMLDREARRCTECGTKLPYLKPPAPRGSLAGTIAPIALLSLLMVSQVGPWNWRFAGAGGRPAIVPLAQGQTGFLSHPESPNLYVARDLDALEQLMEAEKTTDADTLSALSADGAIFETPGGTTVKVVSADEKVVEVELTSGPYRNRPAWVPRDHVHPAELANE